MGKAGKWVMNFLLGKKHGGNSSKVSSKTDYNGAPFQEDCSIETAAVSVLPPQTPKRRWSFGKSTSKDKSLPRRRSTSTVIATFNPLLQASSADAMEHLLLGPSLGNNEAVALAIHEAIKNLERKSNASQAAEPEDRLLRIVSREHAAATRIQAAFWSYLARKALAALKALVKLQALARGHLVRKHMSATIRKMQAVVSIQVRARFQRIQMSEHSQLQQQQQQQQQVVDRSSKAGDSPSHKKRIKIAQSGSNQNMNTNKKDGNLNESERFAARRHSGDLSFLKREGAFEESCYFSSTQTSPGTTRHYKASQQVVSSGQDSSFLEPSYMGKTQSSRAKSRSHSEPRQRPRRSISSNTRQSPSSSVQSGFSSSKRLPLGESQEQWFIKLYRSTVAPPQGGDDYYCDGDTEILVACEPHLNMY